MITSKMLSRHGYLYVLFLLFSFLGNAQTVFYSEDFSSGLNDWTLQSSVQGTWESNSGYVRSSQHGGNDRYRDNTEIVIESPVIDATSYIDLQLSIDVWYDTNRDTGDDGMNIEYSFDGFNWNVLGDSSNANWYDENVSALGADGWTGNQNSFTTKSINLSNENALFDNNSTIVFRVVFESDGNRGDRGVRFDNFEIVGDPLPTCSPPSDPVIGTVTQPTCAVTSGSIELTGLPSGDWVLTQYDVGNATSTKIYGNGATTTISGLNPGTYNYYIDDAVSGFYAEYYDNISLSGSPDVTQVDNEVDFDWGTSSPMTGISVDDFSVRWSGGIEAEFTETYTFETLSDDGIRLWVNGNQIIDNWTDHSATTDTGTIDLVAGERYEIVLEYYENSGDAVAELLWSSASHSREIIPVSNLSSSLNCPSGTTSDTVINSVPTGPAQPDGISGFLYPGNGTNQTYFVTTPVGGITYNWTVPSDWTILSGNGTDTIVVTVGSDSGNIEVTPNNPSCGDGTPRAISVIPGLDSDLDGYSDDYDLDDDNDGILDVDETPSCSITGYEAYYSFDDNTTDDQSVNGHDIQAILPAGPEVYNGSGWNGSSAIEFDGTYLLQYSDGTFLNSPQANFSYSFWINPTSLTGIQVLMEHGYNGYSIIPGLFEDDAGVTIRLNGDRIEVVVTEYGTQQPLDTASLPTLTINNWYHIAFTYDNGVATLYLNDTNSASLNTGFGNLDFGLGTNGFGGINVFDAYGNPDGSFYNGLMDEIYYFRRTLSTSEVSFLYNPVCNDDYDNDGIVNRLDTDSDNDGCPDAVEGDAGLTFGDLDGNNRIVGNVDSNGVPILIGSSGQNLGDSQDETIFGDCSGDQMDFDGNDDYLSTTVDVSGLDEVTMMAWVKPGQKDPGNKWILGQGNFSLKIDNGFKLELTVQVAAGDVSVTTIGNALNKDVWNHVAVSYNGATGTVNLYQDGVNVTKMAGGSKDPDTILHSATNFQMGRNPVSNDEYFEGSIVEAKVYFKELTDVEIREQIYQKIENVGGAVYGVDVPRPIGSLNWTDLQMYLKFDYSFGGIDTSDYSGNGYSVTLNGMNTVQDTNAPLPLIASTSGAWATEATWENGLVWTVEDIEETQPWAIVQLLDNVDLTSGDVNIALFGLIIPETSSFTMDGVTDINTGTGTGNAVTVSDYLDLHGVLDLDGESQLFQDTDADIVIGSNGYLERDQEGTLDTFTYNYWSSPVSESGMDYRLSEVIENVNWVGGYDGSISPLSLAEYWIWTFTNSTSGDYSKWNQVKSSGYIKVGEGFTMKGPGSGVFDFQDYSFRGIPNNGDITLNITPGNDYLVGNPYPSAIDADVFIDDNETVLRDEGGEGGALLFWEHWGGGSHNLKDYQGGYAYYTKAEGVAAVSHSDVSQTDSGTKTPGRYIPVGQGFFISSSSGVEGFGHIEFKNSQRVFYLESTKKSESVFMKSDGRNSTKNKIIGDQRMKIRLGVDMPKGYHRQLLVTVDERSTENIDYGFEARLADNLHHDMYWVLNENNYVIQAIPNINKNTVIPLGFNMKSAGTMKIGVDELENVPENMTVFIEELTSGLTHPIDENVQFEVELEAGEHNDKYALVFHPKLVSEEEITLKEGLSAYLDNDNKDIHISKLVDTEIARVELYNMAGQLIKTWSEKLQGNEVILPVNLNTGVYLLRVETEMGVFSKKLLKN